MIEASEYKDSIQCLAKVSQERKIELMQKSHLISVTSVMEGWKLIVTESNSQGTPAVVCDVKGLRDSVWKKETGYICEKNTPENLSEKILQVMQDKNLYKTLQKNEWELSKGITFERGYEYFKRIILK